jgi:endonuclease YncB( thermonuclease family)
VTDAREIQRKFSVRTYPARIARIKDGDTVVVDIDYGMNLRQEWDARIDGINCWEKDTDAGKAATAFAASVLPLGLLVTVVSLKWDKFGGRIDARIYLSDGSDFAEVMIYAGYAARWNGRGTPPLPPWPIPPREEGRSAQN